MHNLKPVQPQSEEMVSVRRHKETGEPHILTYLGKDYHSSEHTHLVLKAACGRLAGEVVWRNWVIIVLAAQILILVAIMIYK